MWQQFLLSLITALIAGISIIPILKRLKLGQIVRSDGPRSHLYKAGIPTIGGVIFIIPIVVYSLVFTSDIKEMSGMLAAIVGFALVGFLDDILKITRKSKDGLSVMQKSLFLLLVSTIYSVYSVVFTENGSEMIIPFSGLERSVVIQEYIYIPFLILFLYALTNSVNLTDGVDGLAGSVTGIVLLFFVLITSSNIEMYSNVHLLIICAIAGILGFLFFNAHPAKVIMGDTGAMAIGGLVGVIAIYLKIPWILLIVGIVYVVESMSVIIQVGHYKRTKRRVFKMAPIHHHYELSGWKEQKVVLVFSLITVVACIAGYGILGLF